MRLGAIAQARSRAILRRYGALRSSLLAAALPLTLGAGPSAEALLASEPPELVERLLEKRSVMLEDVQGSGAESFVIAYVLFERSLNDVLRLMRQAERQPEYRPELASVRTVRQLENGRIDEQQLKIMFRRLAYHLRYHEDLQRGRLEWKLAAGFNNDLRRLEGFWEFYEFAGGRRTLGRFGSNVDVGGLPKFLQKGMSRRTVLRYVRNCRKWIDSDGEWRP